MKNKKAAELRQKYEDGVRQLAVKKNLAVADAKAAFGKEVKELRSKLYGGNN